ncbi:unannotated protein [freshwater metagenome]|uniref:Unannotated protein n=1 Tax=freshwater metagenome TaxID=449393 RepID=A0A6J7C3Q8_9ZZZZ
MAHGVLDHLIGHEAVALTRDDVEHRLHPDELRERGRHDRLAKLLAHARDLFEHGGQTVGHPMLSQLVLQRARHTAGQLVVVDARVVLGHGAGGESSVAGGPFEVPRHWLEHRGVEPVLEPELLEDRHHAFGRRQRGTIGHRTSGRVQHGESGLESLDVVVLGEPSGVVTVQFECRGTGARAKCGEQSFGAFGLEDTCGVFDVDRLHARPTRHLTGTLGEEGVVMDVGEPVHDRGHRGTPGLVDDLRQPQQRGHVVKTVVDPEARHAVLDQSADPEIHDGVGGEPHPHDVARAHSAANTVVREVRHQEVRGGPGILAELPKQNCEHPWAGEIDDLESGAVQVRQGLRRLVGAQSDAPQTLLPIAERLVDELDGACHDQELLGGQCWAYSLLLPRQDSDRVGLARYCHRPLTSRRLISMVRM